ncbi:MAG: endonuclease/exonuclease/phosphatase family protein, partial [Bacteroidales bacterium]|nr:endonuclease/exonuclease/phosphatase family protein [Bacteroidales bacterium]
PFLSMYKAGFGTLAYQGTWNLFDNIFVNYNLLNGEEGTLHIRPVGKKGFYGVTFRKPWMLEQSGQYKGQPLRTYSSGAFKNGYSDHLPTYIILEK